ncbi:hypothetical protein KZC52_06210 [Microbacterium sp. kSW2-24]|uniref:hypothetical protein n=1 Tax=Microbacterium galbinum TaxID=2851646 RepID=UPI001FFC5C80|nr:hypothetical protein [Microbacterium galbinum]MCK2022509.1 hypothetical protein [Microbacterium galbinum]
MLDAEEAVELRALQARAYGREGRLTTAEMARLEELGSRRDRDPDVEHPSGPEPVTPGGEVAPSEIDAHPHDQESAENPSIDRPRRSAIRRTITIAVAIVVVFGIGTVAGWLLTRPAEHVIVISEAQQQWQQRLVDGGEYDAGSIRVMAVEADVVVWAATKGDGASTCLVFSDGEVYRPTCNGTDAVRSSGMDAALTVDVDDELKRQVSAQLFLTLDGRPAVLSQSFLYGEADNYGMLYDEDQSRIAENLVALGFERTSLWIAGYDRDTPVWAATRTATGQTCVIYDGSGEAPLSVCDPNAAEEAGARSLAFERPDEETGGTTRITYAYGAGPSYLEIARESAPGEAK